jgi:hypothetical protein
MNTSLIQECIIYGNQIKEKAALEEQYFLQHLTVIQGYAFILAIKLMIYDCCRDFRNLTTFKTVYTSADRQKELIITSACLPNIEKTPPTTQMVEGNNYCRRTKQLNPGYDANAHTSHSTCTNQRTKLNEISAGFEPECSQTQ